jgi:phosphohistidine phosphatase
MKRLILVRHAKSSRDNPAVIDFDRDLNDRGYKDAALMGDYIKNLSLKPDLIISSPALRARMTANIIAGKLEYPKSGIRFYDKLYEANPSDVVDILLGLEDNVNFVMLFGHNPYISSVSSYLTGKPFIEIPTTGTLEIIFNINNWSDVSNTLGETGFYQVPKNLKDAKG